MGQIVLFESLYYKGVHFFLSFYYTFIFFLLFKETYTNQTLKFLSAIYYEKKKKQKIFTFFVISFFFLQKKQKPQIDIDK